MKTIFFSIVATLFLIAPMEAQKSSEFGTQKIHLRFGRVSMNCGGFGICLFDIDLEIEDVINIVQAFGKNGKVNVAFSAETFNLNKSKFPNNNFLVEEDFVVSPAAARALGFSKYVVKKGSYPVVLDPKTNTYNCTF